MRRWGAGAIACAVLLVIAVALTSSCGGGGESMPESPTIVIGATATPLPSATPSAYEEHTGIPEVDALIDALAVEPVRARREALQPLFHYSPMACSFAPTQGNPQPLCRAGEEQGQPVDAVSFDNCGLQYLRPDETAQLLVLLSNSVMYAVYRAPPVAYTGSADYIAVVYDIAGDERRAARLLLYEGGITSYTYSCEMTPEDYVTALQLTDVIYQAPGQ
jgi:hypothetical protein